MKRSEPIVRLATREDIDAFFGPRAKPTMKAWVGEFDGRPIGIGGLAFVDGRWIAFCDLTPEARRYKWAIVRTGKLIMEEARRSGIRFVYAEADTKEPMALRWLGSLGFECDERGGRLFRWQASARRSGSDSGIVQEREARGGGERSSFPVAIQLRSRSGESRYPGLVVSEGLSRISAAFSRGIIIGIRMAAAVAKDR